MEARDAWKLVALYWVLSGDRDLLIHIDLPSSFFNAGLLGLCKGLDMPVHGILNL